MQDRLIQMNMYGANSEGGLTFWQCSKFQGSDMYGVEGFPTGIANNFVKIENSRDLDLTEVFTEIVNEAAEKYPASTGIRADMSVSEGKGVPGVCGRGGGGPGMARSCYRGARVGAPGPGG